MFSTVFPSTSFHYATISFTGFFMRTLDFGDGIEEETVVSNCLEISSIDSQGEKI